MGHGDKWQWQNFNENMNANDIYLQKFTAQNTFAEAPLSVQPNKIVATDSASNLIMVSASMFITTAQTASLATSASYSNTASYLQLWDSGLGQYVIITSVNMVLTASRI